MRLSWREAHAAPHTIKYARNRDGGGLQARSRENKRGIGQSGCGNRNGRGGQKVRQPQPPRNLQGNSKAQHNPQVSGKSATADHAVTFRSGEGWSQSGLVSDQLATMSTQLGACGSNLCAFWTDDHCARAQSFRFRKSYKPDLLVYPSPFARRPGAIRAPLKRCSEDRPSLRALLRQRSRAGPDESGRAGRNQTRRRIRNLLQAGKAAGGAGLETRKERVTNGCLLRAAIPELRRSDTRVAGRPTPASRQLQAQTTPLTTLGAVRRHHRAHNSTTPGSIQDMDHTAVVLRGNLHRGVPELLNSMDKRPRRH